MARPKKNINRDEVEKLAMLQCTMSEVASFFDVNVSTISRRFAKEMTKGREKGKMSLRRKQWKLADTNASMAIFLGKNYLDQKDSKEVDANHTFDGSELAKALKEADTSTD